MAGGNFLQLMYFKIGTSGTSQYLQGFLVGPLVGPSWDLALKTGT